MDYKVFYRKYRPKNFDELVGQDTIKDVLINSIKINKIAHAYIFTGPRGTGKTSTAKIFAKTLNCLDNGNGISCDECDMCKSYSDSADIIEIDAASNNGVDEIRSLRDSVKISPYSSKYKVYIIDEVHMLSNSAWNALLKTLEEPPSHVIFILATTEVNKIPETVMSRCQRFDFSKIPSNLMYNHLYNICSKEKLNITDEALKEIVKLSNGCLRDSLSTLDQVSKHDCEINIELIEDNFGIVSKFKLNELYNSIYTSDKVLINKLIENIEESGLTPLNFINNFVDFLLNKIISNEYFDSSEMKSIKELIYNLNELITKFNSIVNPFTLIKVELITSNYFPGNKNVNISQHEYKQNVNNLNEEKEIEKNDIKKELDNEQIKINVDISKDINLTSLKSINIRVNNSFVNASKNLKNEFCAKWSKLITKMNIENEYSLLGYIESANVEVVSKTNVIFSFNSKSDALIFNNNLLSIESIYNNEYNSEYKFIALSLEEWKIEKNNFINNKAKKYEYIDESQIENEENIKSKDIATDIFGEDIIEIK